MEREINTVHETPHWSYSAFNTFLTCPMRYYFRYIEHAEVERTSVSIPFGRAFHAVLSERAMKGTSYTIEDAKGIQREIGHWVNKDHYNYDVMGTCLAALQLMVYYRYLPTTQLKATEVAPDVESLSKEKTGEVNVEVDI